MCCACITLGVLYRPVEDHAAFQSYQARMKIWVHSRRRPGDVFVRFQYRCCSGVLNKVVDECMY